MHLQTGVSYVPYLEFESYSLYRKILKKTRRLHTREAIGPERLWLSAYFQKDLLSGKIANVSVRLIDEEIGCGVFAESDFASMEFIAEYTGIVRGRRAGDESNSYCFEYLLLPDEPTDYLIDAQNQGGVSRYINHSNSPNLSSAMVSVAGVSHIIIYTTKPVKKGTELRYDYGPDYWKKRGKPR